MTYKRGELFFKSNKFFLLIGPEIGIDWGLVFVYDEDAAGRWLLKQGMTDRKADTVWAFSSRIIPGRDRITGMAAL